MVSNFCRQKSSSPHLISKTHARHMSLSLRTTDLNIIVQRLGLCIISTNLTLLFKDTDRENQIYTGNNTSLEKYQSQKRRKLSTSNWTTDFILCQNFHAVSQNTCYFPLIKNVKRKHVQDKSSNCLSPLSETRQVQSRVKKGGNKY